MDLSEETGAEPEEEPEEEYLPRYRQIAFDLASKIADGTYEKGHRLYARSALAGQYGVSSETARRAICILSDMGIVETVKGGGVLIISVDKAVAFLREFRQMNAVSELKKKLLRSVERQQEEAKNISELLDTLIQRAERFKASNPFVPYQTTVPVDSPLIGKTLVETDFWHSTGATVVGVRRGEKLTLSPGPGMVIRSKDILYFICEPEWVDRVNAFLSTI